MRGLQLDYQRRRGPRLAAYVLALFAGGFLVDAAMHFESLERDIAVKEARLASRMHLRKAEPTAAARAFNAEEYAYARETVRRLATPWDALFQALEASQTDRIALLAVEPDVENRALILSGEAKDYLAAVSYVAQLRQQSTLSRVHLVRHENRRTGSRPLSFTVSASWKEGR